MTNIFSNISKAVLMRAAEIKGKIEDLESELSSMLNRTGVTFTATASITPLKSIKRKLSPATRAKIAAGARARWAKIRGNKSSKAKSMSAGVTPVAKRKRVSAATKAKLRSVAKERWAKIKAAGKTSL